MTELGLTSRNLIGAFIDTSSAPILQSSNMPRGVIPCFRDGGEPFLQLPSALNENDRNGPEHFPP